MALRRENPLLPGQQIIDMRQRMREALLQHVDTETQSNAHRESILSALLAVVALAGALIIPAELLQNDLRELHAAAASPELTETTWVPGTLVATNITLPAQPDPPYSPPPPPDAHIGVYLTGNSIARGDGFFDQTMEQVKEASSPALVIDVKESYVFYDSSSPLAEQYGLVQEKYNLAETVQKAKEKGIYVIARFVAGKDSGLATANSDTQIHHPATGVSVGSVWVDLANDTVQQYNRELLEEVVNAGVDEVNIDYIRYPTEYTPAQVGLPTEEKVRHVESFIKMARSVINTSNPEVKLGLSTFAILGWDYAINLERLGQDVALFAPYVDIISPMAYPASFAPGHYYTGETGRSRMYELVYKTEKGYDTILGETYKHKLRPWIQGYRVTSRDLQDQIDAVYDSGACGFLVWSPSNLYAPLYTTLENFSAPARCNT